MVRPMNETPCWQVRLLIRRRHDDAVEERTFRQNEITIGRVAGNDIALLADNCSRRHCMLKIDNEGRVWVRDMGSSNGTWLRKSGEIVRGDNLLELGDAVYVGGYAIELAAAPEPVIEGQEAPE